MSAFKIALKLFLAVCITLVFLPFQLFSLWIKSPARDIIPIYWHRCILKILGFKVRIEGAPLTGSPAIFVANHISWSDIVVFGSVAKLSFIAKSDMASWPVFGHLAKLQRVVFVERMKRTQAGQQADVIAKRLSEGDSLVLFAEGTTGDGLRLLPFKSTLIGAAHKAAKTVGDGKIAIQPVAIAYTHRGGLKLSRTDMDGVAWVGDQELGPHLKGVLAGSEIDCVLHFTAPIWVDGTSDRKAISRQAEVAVEAHFVASLRDRSVPQN